MTVPQDREYTPEHEWVLRQGDAVTVGITDFAAGKLGDVVYVDLPPVGSIATAGTIIGEIESTKSVGELYAPVDGTVSEVNGAVDAQPQLVNGDPYGQGWLVRITIDGAAGEGPELLTPEQYAALAAG